MAIQPRMLMVGVARCLELGRSSRDAEGITAISRWSSEANKTGSQPPSGRTPAGVPHLFEPEVKSVGVGFPERRGQAYSPNSDRLRSESSLESALWPDFQASFLRCRRLPWGVVASRDVFLRY
jgi:hypothetical protein